MLMISIVVQNIMDLRKNFLVRLLKYHQNEALENIPYIVQHTLRSIEEDIFLI
jgi:hypothetical protein